MTDSVTTTLSTAARLLQEKFPGFTIGQKPVSRFNPTASLVLYAHERGDMKVVTPAIWMGYQVTKKYLGKVRAL